MASRGGPAAETTSAQGRSPMSVTALAAGRIGLPLERSYGHTMLTDVLDAPCIKNGAVGPSRIAA